MSNYHYDIVIVGAGTAGACLASHVALSSPDLRIALVDAQAQAPCYSDKGYDTRVIAVSKATEAQFRALGIWDVISARRACPYQHMEVWDGEGTAGVEFDSAAIREESLGHIVENSAIVAALHERLASLASVEIIRSATVASLTLADDALAGTTIHLDDGRSLTADLLVGADGGRSSIRTLAGFDVVEWAYGHTSIVATVETELPHQFTARQRFTTEGPLAFLPLSPDCQNQQYCSIVWSVNTDIAGDLMALDSADFCVALASAFEHRLGRIASVDRRASFPLKQCRAKRYVKPGVVLVGDAAHTIHPLAGQGANLGFYDVDVLAQEVARACARGLAVNDPSVGRRYERRRMPHNLAAMSAMEGFKRVFGSDNLHLRLLRNEGFRLANRFPGLKGQLSKIASGAF